MHFSNEPGFPEVRVAGDAGLGVPEDAPTTGQSSPSPASTSGDLVRPAQARRAACRPAALARPDPVRRARAGEGEGEVFRAGSVFLCGFVPMIGQGWECSAALDAQELVRLY
jgi:hypothetical protein